MATSAMIPVYFGRRHTVTVEGFVWQVVECEHCDLEWAFQVRVSGIGGGVSPYYLDEKGARRRASERARESLEQDRQLAREGVSRNVACPGCNRYQREMVASLRRTHGASWATAAVVCLLVASVLALRALTDDAPLASNLGWIVPSALLFAVGILLLVRRNQLRLRFDPNTPGSGRDTPGEHGPAVISRKQYDDAELADRPAIQWRRP